MHETATTGTLEACACPQCGSWDSSIHLQSPDRQFPSDRLFCVSKCASCGLLFQNPRIPLADLPQHYPATYSPYRIDTWLANDPLQWHLKHRQGYAHLQYDGEPSARQKRCARWSSNYMLLPDYRPGGHVVEMGCAAGNRLALLHSLGWEHCIGYEYSDGAAEHARERGFNVVSGPVESAMSIIEDASLDAVIAGFMLEHVPDPYALVRACAAKLKPGGQLLFSTINIESPDYWWYREHWYDLDLPRHMVFFRKQDLRSMLKDAFRIESIFTESVPMDYMGSAAYRLRDGSRGWRRPLDSAVVKLGARLARLYYYVARAGLGGRIYVSARRT
jgi:2-polyprenyl-3-methyl-5-hydroxy-6-metoxy-1,4-benzoquinol methylase